MLVECNNKNKIWCPYGTQRCHCDVFYPHELKPDEDFWFTCTDINDDIRDCVLVRFPENEIEFKVNKLVQMVLRGRSFKESVKIMNIEEMKLSDFLRELSKNEYSDVSLVISRRNK